MAKRKRKTGLPPGTLVFTGKKRMENPDVTVIQYDPNGLSEHWLQDNLCPEAINDKVTWYDVRGLHDIELIQRIGDIYQIHPLALEDILNVHQRPKMEEYDTGIFVVVRALRFEEEKQNVNTEQVGFYLGENFVLTFQEDADDLFPEVRERLGKGQGKLRQRKADYLAYTLLDSIVDNYYLVLDELQDCIESLEQQIMQDAERIDKTAIYNHKRQLMEIRKAVFPMREVCNRLLAAESKYLNEASNIFIRDLSDHISQLVDTIENQKDTLSELYDQYHAEMGQRANHVMKLLTVVSAIFIPLTFIVGVYGTNFSNLPEKDWHYGYFLMWGVMLLIGILQLIYFKRKRWI